MFYARYIVLEFKNQFGTAEVPFLLSDADGHGWERPRGVGWPRQQEVLGAGFVTWDEADPASVACFGNGKIEVLNGTGFKTRQVASRGAVDAALVQDMLAEPLHYVILHLNGRDVPIFSTRDVDHEAMVLRYQVYPSRCAVSAGEVDFGHEDGLPLFCYGDFYGNPGFTCPSRGDEDVAFLKAHLVKHTDNPGPGRAYPLF